MGCCHGFGNVEQLSASWFSAIAGLGWFGRLEAWRRSYTDVTCDQANLSLFTLSGSNLLHTLTVLLRPVPQAQRGLKSRLMQKGVCRETIPHRKKRTLPSLQRSGPWCNELSCQLLYPESTSHLEQELNRNAIPQPSAMEWLQKYRQEYAAAPDTVQQLLAFARNRGGSLSFSEAQRLFHQGLHLKPEEEQEEPSEHPWLHPWLQSSDAELASAPCRLVGLLSLRAVSSHHKLGGIWRNHVLWMSVPNSWIGFWGFCRAVSFCGSQVYFSSVLTKTAEDCPLADYGGYLSSDDDLDLHPNFQGESSLVQTPHRCQLPLLNKK